MNGVTTARRRISRNLFLGVSGLALAGAGFAGWRFASQPVDMVLLQLTFYGAWCCLFGARVGGHLGAMMEEDCCSDLDMGVLSSMGSMLGTLSAGLIGTALTGLAISTVPWWQVFAGFVAFAGIHAAVGAFAPLRLVRLAGIDRRGRALGSDGRPLPVDPQAPRMPDRVGVLLAMSAVILFVLTMIMALMMGRDFGAPFMMAPMMYGMFGTMIGGMLGGWLAGLLDEHEGHPDHDNPVMVAAMAMMAGMMGGMPSGMIGGMMAVMGWKAIAWTVAGGGLMAGLAWVWVMRGRYRVVRLGSESEITSANLAAPFAAPGTPTGSATLSVQGMTCEACRTKVTRKVGELPGVIAVDADVAAGRVRIEWGEGFGGLEGVRERIGRLGYVVRDGGGDGDQG